MTVFAAPWGGGKCPICERPHQKRLRIVWVEDAKGNILELAKLCAWCFIPLFVKMLRADPELHVEWRTGEEYP